MSEKDSKEHDIEEVVYLPKHMAILLFKTSSLRSFLRNSYRRGFRQILFFKSFNTFKVPLINLSDVLKFDNFPMENSFLCLVNKALKLQNAYFLLSLLHYKHFGIAYYLLCKKTSRLHKVTQ